jgi:hypothetical protein
VKGEHSMTLYMTHFAVVQDIYDWYRNWAPRFIVDQSFLKIELYRINGLFLILVST